MTTPGIGGSPETDWIADDNSALIDYGETWRLDDLDDIGPASSAAEHDDLDELDDDEPWEDDGHRWAASDDDVTGW